VSTNDYEYAALLLYRREREARTRHARLKAQLTFLRLARQDARN